ncbi:MAG: PDDEXK nuclease domain-containing protein [Bacteroidetes bacterium]|nr:PDDEXK nuclease domain-containing protein [Bacteroidota bacterium]
MDKHPTNIDPLDERYQVFYNDISMIVDFARGHATRSINATMTAAYWLTGRHIIDFEQEGKERANYGAEVIKRLSIDLSARFGRGFSVRNLWQMRSFYLLWPEMPTLSDKSDSNQKRPTPSVESGSDQKRPTPSVESVSDQKQQTPLVNSGNNQKHPTPSVKSDSSQKMPISLSEPLLVYLASQFPLPWSAYVRLLSVKNPYAREFYEIEALRGGWSVRQLDRQINSQFYERTALSKDKVAMLKKGGLIQDDDTLMPEEAIKDPYVLEFLNLKDEYSESDLEEALIKHLQSFLLELGDGFTFVARQKRLRVGDAWFRVDLVFYHRTLQCLVIIDLKLGKFTPADAGQMHLYLNYAKENWMMEGENPPVGLVLCNEKDESVARYALEGLSNKVMATEYRTTLPDEELLASEINRARKAIHSSDLLMGTKMTGSQDNDYIKDSD